LARGGWREKGEKRGRRFKSVFQKLGAPRKEGKCRKLSNKQVEKGAECCKGGKRGGGTKGV